MGVAASVISLEGELKTYRRRKQEEAIITSLPAILLPSTKSRADKFTLTHTFAIINFLLSLLVL